jgi:serine/threonine protein kinase
MVGHVRPEELAGFSSGELDDEAITRVEEHLTECGECRDRLRFLPPDRLTGLLREPSADRQDERGLNTASWVSHPRYRIVARLGGGGMGVVYKAEQLVMKRIVALKVIGPRLAASAAAIARFRREIEALARLQHANIATAYDADETDGQLVLVEEYVEGEDLAQVVRERGPLPVAEACNYLRQAALALQHAHERGILHRDVKPSNLIVTADGHVKVLDFGLACLRDQQEEVGTAEPMGAAAPQAGSMLTNLGQGLGTAEFAAPELVRDAQAADARSDVYSLGRTLVFLLTARFGAPLPPNVPGALAGVLTRMTASDPDARFQTMSEVAVALATAAGAATRRRRRKPLLLALVAVVLLALFGAWLSRRPDVPAKADPAPAEKFIRISIENVATANTTRPMYGTPSEELIFPTWGEQKYEGIPFDVPAPKDGKPNAIALRAGWLGIYPKEVSVACGVACKTIHLLSGMSCGGWHPGREDKGVAIGVAMVVRLHYADGGTEDHELLNGVDFANFRGINEVPGSKLAFKLKAKVNVPPSDTNQVRYLAVAPKKPTVRVDTIEFLKGDNGDGTSPIVMAITVERP